MIDELKRLGAELRQTFAAERHAIVVLDHAQLELLAETKRSLAHKIQQLKPSAIHDPSCRELFAALRLEAHATAMLAVVATDAVHAMLGYDTSEHYDHRARRVVHGSSRVLTTY